MRSDSGTLSLELKVGQEAEMGAAASGQRGSLLAGVCRASRVHGGDLTPGASLSPCSFWRPLGETLANEASQMVGAGQVSLGMGARRRFLNTDLKFLARSPISVCTVVL